MAVAAPQPSTGTEGRVIAITGPVVDIEFPPGQLPSIYNAVVLAPENGEAPEVESNRPKLSPRHP